MENIVFDSVFAEKDRLGRVARLGATLSALFMALVLALVVGFATVPAALADETQVDGVTVVFSATSDAAAIEGANFGVHDFSRLGVGSNRRDASTQEYLGYGYYLGPEEGWVAVVVTEDYVLCYVSIHATAAFPCDIDSAVDRDNLQRMIVALDGLEDNNKASTRALTMEDKFIFTSDPVYRVGDVVYRFETQLNPGEYWVTVMGADGSDVASRSGNGAVRISHVDCMLVGLESDVIIVDTPTGFAAVKDFLSRLNWSPLWVTLKTTGAATILIFILGLAAAYFSLRIRPKWQNLADTLFTIPMVLPPTVCGFLLLLLCGSNTAFGQFMKDIGFPLVFSWPATVIAASVVAFPLMYRSARGAFESLDQNMLDAARTLGWSNTKIFFKLMLPLAWSSIAAGTVLSLARALGEFGATMFLAGNYLGVTRTIPIAIYFEWMNGNTDIALFWTGVIIVISFLVILFINLYSKRTTKYRRPVMEEEGE